MCFSVLNIPKQGVITNGVHSLDVTIPHEKNTTDSEFYILHMQPCQTSLNTATQNSTSGSHVLLHILYETTRDVESHALVSNT